MTDPLLEKLRFFLKDTIRRHTDFSRTDQNRGVPAPPIEKPWPPDAARIALPPVRPGESTPACDLAGAIARRRSRRDFLPEPVSLETLSFLLWATQGIRQVLDRGHALRTVPSAGCRHALETYLCALNVAGLDPGIYRYLPLEHELLPVSREDNPAAQLVAAALGQPCLGRAAVTFLWTVIPYRMEWRYGQAAHKVIALDAGHVCQNLYLACEAAGLGTCAVAAYDQEAMDRLLGVDGEEEFVIYLAPVGKARD
ncbi:MAG TPA: SagB/ThcOx family dehydrogenase [Syntrophales bacterium]|nr:SagB/ThcOx family dehydrogenase [Syntrophales bacterium]